MPRTPITPQKVTSAGRVVAFEAANVDGNSFTPVPGRALLVRNGSAASVTVTVPTPATVDGLSIDDRAIPVAAGAELVFGLGAFPGVYGQTDGAVHVNYSAVTTVTVAVVDLP